MSYLARCRGKQINEGNTFAMTTGIHHVAIIVASEESVEFYKRLGFEEFYRINRAYDTIALLSGCGIVLELFIDPRHSPRMVPEPLGLRHIAFQVDKIEKTMNDLEIDPSKLSFDWMGRRYCNITDPDGNAVELHE